MKNLPLLAALLILAGGCSTGADPAVKEDPVRVLLTCGGHKFQEKEFNAFWEGFDDMKVTRLDLPEGFPRLRSGLEKEFDVIVRYDMIQKIPADQCKAFSALIREGKVGLVALHHNLGAHNNWPGYTDIIRGRFVRTPTDYGGKTYPKSTWKHGQDVPVSVRPGSHELIRGIKDFEIHDETYGGVYVDPKVNVLLTTDHPLSTKQLLWTSRYGKGRVATFMLGHDNKAWENGNFRKIIRRTVLWAGNRLQDSGSPESNSSAGTSPGKTAALSARRSSPVP